MHFALVIPAEMQIPACYRIHSFSMQSKNARPTEINISCPKLQGDF